MPITTPIICRDPATFAPVITFVPVDSGSAVSTAPTAIKNIQFDIITRSTGLAAYDVTQAMPGFLPEWVVTSETPAVATVTGSRVNKVANGAAMLRITGPYGFSKTASVTFTSSSSLNYVWTGFAGVTASSKLSEPILALLSPVKQKNIYSAYGVKNTNCWAFPMDLTGSPVATSLGGIYGTSNSGALVTPQHWVGVDHWSPGGGAANIGQGSTLTFVGSNGTLYARTVLRRDFNQTKDRIVCLLDSPLPATVKPFKLAGASMLDAPNQRFLGMGWQITQEKNITPIGFDDFTADFKSLFLPGAVKWISQFPENTEPTHRLNGLSGLLQQGRPGDSGGAIGGYYNGETYLVSLFTSSNAGYLYTANQAAELNGIIAALDAAQGISTGYTVGVLEII
jgi:hypothetical protein